MFPKCSHQVSKLFPKFSMCSLRHSQKHLSFVPYCWTIVQLPCMEVAKWELTKLWQSMLLLWVGFFVGECPMFQIILVMGQSKSKREIWERGRKKKTWLTDCGGNDYILYINSLRPCVRDGARVCKSGRPSPARHSRTCTWACGLRIE
jgi:hypothetical protein